MPNHFAASERIIDAYNAKEFPLLRELVSPTVDMAHFNRNYATGSLDDLLQTMELFASQLMPDRRFEAPERVHQLESIVIRESYWGGTPKMDIPGFASAGVTLRIRICSVMRFDDTGMLVEWKDYG